MKNALMISTIVAWLLVGCEYESPLTKERSMAIDPAVLGLWEEKPDEGNKPKPDERMMILKYSDTEYLIHYPAGEDGMYFRGYPIKIGGISCVQLHIIGAKNGPPKKEQRKIFHVVSFKLKNNGLEIRTLNTDLVNKDLKTAEELRKAFLKHKDNKDLFQNPGVFRKKDAGDDK